jgi:hypothetical protein
MPERIAWKVVRKDGDGWKSAIVNGKACVHYAIGERSQGLEGAPVMVFLSKEQARRWQLSGFPRRAILQGLAGNPRPQEGLVDLGWLGKGYWLRAIRRFWKRGDKYRGTTAGTPFGTHAADWFEPEKEVSR